MRRKPVNPDTAQAEGVDYLLREFKALRTASPTTGAVAGATGDKIDPTFFVAASAARPEVKARADYVCDGVADQEEINAAITALDELAPAWGEGGVIQLSGGTFYCTDQILIPAVATVVWLRGMGMNATRIEDTDDAPTTRDGLVEALGSYPVISDVDISCYYDGFRNAIYMDPNYDYSGRIAHVLAYIGSTTEAEVTAAISAGSDVTLEDVEIVAGNEGDGINLFGNGGRNLVTGCRIRGATTQGYGSGYGILVGTTNVHNVRIVNSYIDNCAAYAIVTSGDNGIIVGNQVADGVLLNAAADGTVVGGNIGAITDNGTNTVFLDNTGVLASVVKHDNFTQAGALSVGSGAIRYYTQTDRTITGCYAMVSGAPSGSAAIFDVNIDGTTAYTTQGNRPTVAAAGYLSTVTVPDVTAWDTGSYLTIDVDAANSATDLILVVQYTEA